MTPHERHLLDTLDDLREKNRKLRGCLLGWACLGEYIARYEDGVSTDTIQCALGMVESSREALGLTRPPGAVVVPFRGVS